MLYCPDDGQELEAFMRRMGMPRLYYAFEGEGSKVIANLSTNSVIL